MKSNLKEISETFKDHLNERIQRTSILNDEAIKNIEDAVKNINDAVEKILTKFRNAYPNIRD